MRARHGNGACDAGTARHTRRWAVPFACALAAVPACKAKNASVTLDATAAVTVEGMLDTGTLPSGATPVAALIDARGARHDAPLAYDAVTGRFSLAVPRSFLLPPFSSDPETWTAMGPKSPWAAAESGKALANQAFAYARLEISAAPADGVLPYRQLYVPIPRHAALAKSGEVAVLPVEDGPIRLGRVGRKRVRVVGPAGESVPQAAVVAWALTNANDRMLRADPMFTPVAHAADAQGEALVHPIPQDGAEPSYQVAAFAAGHCAAASEPVIAHKGTDDEALTLTLAPCPAPADPKKPAARFAFHDSVTTLADEGGARKAYVNGEAVRLRVDAEAPVLRGFEAYVYEGAEAEGKVLVQQTFPTFSSEPTLRLPAVFPGTGSAEGAFTIAVRLRQDPADRARFGEATRTVLRGFRSRKAAVLPAQNLTVTSRMGRKGLIAGDHGIPFTVDVAGCAPGAAVALGLAPVTDAGAAAFKACDAGPIAFLPEDAGFPAAGGIGGTHVLHYAYRDAFGNLNRDAIAAGEAKIPVYVDYGTPALASQGLAFFSDFGLARAGASPGALATEARVTPDTVDQWVARFARASACRHGSPGVADGDSLTGLGHVVAAFRVAADDAPQADAASFTRCGEDAPLAGKTWVFPTDERQDWAIRYQIIDAAGHVSDVGTWSLPPCVSGAGICWAPR